MRRVAAGAVLGITATLAAECVLYLRAVRRFAEKVLA
jgi:hypothetical protein